ncbi:TetR/AcrR family transcriptional regulator [Achromobacter sp. GG226]|uniref:TetR/AcrR family transcriptional regulator n=1 Tax=Verticiella alkaliphila TaxID=2779529 RepID=UPI001C0D1DEB|nr:TetR/AcrR family transcriptional regulator [Verticiella sp. GG226]MBU4609491.1 TetR/AcrR family transcriptional regulator [Verticiella sp. GG226]
MTLTNPTPSRQPRRSHAERSAATRGRLIATAIDVIESGGLEDMSIHQLARRAGLSSGAVQHHFESKAALMMRVLESLLASDAWEAHRLPPADSALPSRARFFLQALWERLYAQPRFIAAWHIYLSSRGQPEVLAEVAEQRRVLNDKMRSDFLAALPELHALPETRRDAVVATVLSTLRGLGLLALFPGDPGAPQSQLDCLAELLVSQCGADLPPTQAG